MHKIITLIILFSILLIPTISLANSVDDGRRIFMKKIKANCAGMACKEFASKHSHAEWVEIIYDNENFKNELKKICPKFNKNTIPKQYHWNRLIDFTLYESKTDEERASDKRLIEAINSRLGN